MRRSRVLLSMFLLVLASAVVSPSILPRAHAALTGLVCLQDPNNPSTSTSTPCPASAPTFDGPAPGSSQTSPTQIKIGVYISGSDSLNGFDITLVANHTILRPAGVDTTGTVVPGSTTVITECLSNVTVVGPRCAPYDTSDTLHFALQGGFGLLTTAPTTGLLFVAIYNITTTALTSGISVGFQTGCTGSDSSSPPLCVNIVNGMGVPDSETTQAAAFNNHTNPPWVAVSSNSTSLNFLSTTTTGNHASIVATAKNGWPGVSTDLVSFSARTNSSGLTSTFSAPSCVTNGSSCSVVLTLNGVGGNYSVTVFGQYVLKDTSFASQTDTLVGPVTLHVIVRDYFRLTPNPSSTIAFATAVATSKITVAPLNGYTGTVLLSSSVTPAGLACSLAPSTIVLGASQNSSLSCNGTTGVYTVTVTGSASGITHTSTVTVTLQDFSLTASPTSLSVNTGASPTFTISFGSLNGFSGSVGLSAGCSSFPVTGSGGGGGGASGGGGARFYAMLPFGWCPTLSFNPATVSLPGGGTVFSTLSVSSLNAAGNYSIFVYADSALGRHTTVVRLVISDFIANVPSVYLSVDVGSSTSSTISLTSLVSFSGNVGLSAVGSPTGLTLALNPSTVSLTSSSTANSVLTVTAPTGTPTGSYSVTVTATGGGVSHSIIFTVQVHPAGFLDPQIRSIVQHSTSFALGAVLLGLVILSALITVRRAPPFEWTSPRRNREFFAVASSGRRQWVIASNALGGPMMVSLSRQSR